MEQPTLSSNTDCVCPGSTLTFTCSVLVQGGLFIQWRGSAFKDGCSMNILLRTTNFFATHTCNNNTISGRGVNITSIDGTNAVLYKSELNISMSNDLNDSTVECVLVQGDQETIANTTLILSTAGKSTIYMSLIARINVIIMYTFIL